MNFLYTTALFRASGLAETSGSRSERGCRDHTHTTSTFRSRRDPALRYCLRVVHLSRTSCFRSSLTREKIQHLSENVYPNRCRYFPVSGGGIGDLGNGRSSAVLLAGCGPWRPFWDNVPMRNTPKSESLLRMRADRLESDNTQRSRGAAVSSSDEDSEVAEPGSRGRGATMRSARAELSAHARGVESMNEALHPWRD